MRILIVTATYSPSINGVALTLNLQKSEFEKRGNKVTILAPKHPNQKYENGVIRIPSLPNPKIPDYPILVPIPTIHNLQIFTEKFDIIYFHHPFYIGDLSLTLAKYFKCPTVFYYHSRYEKIAQLHFPRLIFFPIINYLIKRNVGMIANQASQIIVGTQSVKQLLLRHKIKTPICVIPAIRKSMQIKNKSKSELKKRYGFADNEIIILCVSRLSKEKNLTTLLKIIKQVKSDRAFRLCLVGGGPEEKYLRKMANRLGLVRQTRFFGPVNHNITPQIYSLADIFAYPSRVDTQAIVILEAMSSGLPVVGFDCPGPKDFIQNNNNGYLVSNNLEFAQKLGELINNNLVRKKIGSNSLMTSKKYSFENSVDELENIFKKVVSEFKF